MNDFDGSRHSQKVAKHQKTLAEYRRRQQKETHRINIKYRSTMHYLLASIVPYTEANLKLSFSPRRFFDDLARIEDTTGSRSKYRNAYYRAIKLGLLELKGNSPHLTHKGVRTLSAYQPKLLSGQTRLLIAFDIPEQERQLRNKLRTILKEYKFRQVQKSVWESRYDCLKSLKTTIEQCSLENYVRFYEAEPLS